MQNKSKVSIRVIANEKNMEALMKRITVLCEDNNFNFSVLQSEPYWKIEGQIEALIELAPCPVWNYGKWSEVYKYLFGQGFTIEWETNEDISFCYYPEYNDLSSYFVIFHISSDCFWPKPSKTILH